MFSKLSVVRTAQPDEYEMIAGLIHRVTRNRSHRSHRQNGLNRDHSTNITPNGTKIWRQVPQILQSSWRL
ncbi:MAG: hypothetical protein CL726_08175 [Chloroflexi bacterium]|nr:hypothetical protein [Chloroflexota bacterium]